MGDGVGNANKYSRGKSRAVTSPAPISIASRGATIPAARPPHAPDFLRWMRRPTICHRGATGRMGRPTAAEGGCHGIACGGGRCRDRRRGMCGRTGARRISGHSGRPGGARRRTIGKLWQRGLDKPGLGRADVDAGPMDKDSGLSPRSGRTGCSSLAPCAEAAPLAGPFPARRIHDRSCRGDLFGACRAAPRCAGAPCSAGGRDRCVRSRAARRPALRLSRPPGLCWRGAVVASAPGQRRRLAGARCR